MAKRKVLMAVALACLTVAGIALAADAPQKIRVGGAVQAQNIISKVAPVYPPEAKQKRVEGTVRLEVTIDKDGHVSQIAIVSGPAELTQSATDAVRQWSYKPTLLNGEPVEVQTTVDVNYTLSQ